MSTAWEVLSARVEVDVDYDRRVHFAMQQNDVPVIRAIRLRHLEEAPSPSAEPAAPDRADLEDIEVSAWIDAELSVPWSARIARLPKGASYTLAPVDLCLKPDVLSRQIERQSAQLCIAVQSRQQLLARKALPIDVFAFNEWPGLGALPEILAAFVLPNHPAVLTLLSAAARHLEHSTRNPSFDGYSSRDPGRAQAMLEAIYRAVADRNLSYVRPPSSFEQQGQKIRTPDQIAEFGQATCLDLVLLFAALLEQAGLRSSVLFAKDHALLAAWRVEDHFPEVWVEDLARLRKRAALGELVLLETIGVTSRPVLPFEQALERGRLYLDESEETFVGAIDLFAARRQRIRPLPTRAPLPVQDGTQEVNSSEVDVLSSPQTATTQTPTAGPPDPSTRKSPVAETARTRLDRWKRRLLDLSLRNRLIHYVPTRKTIPLLGSFLGEIEDALMQGRSFTVEPRPDLMPEGGPRDARVHLERTGKNALAEYLTDELAERRLHADLPAEDLQRRLVELFRAARLSIEETGANTLYLALGFLQWFETKDSSEARRAPILLVPLVIERESVRLGFRIRMADEDARCNVTLIEKLRSEFPIDVQGLHKLDLDEKGLDVAGILLKFRQAIKHLDRWDVYDEAHIGLFSFSKFLLWMDLEARAGTLLKNAVVRHLVDRPNALFDAKPFPELKGLDRLQHPRDTFCPLDADSSQLAVVQAAAEGRSFVLEGPPGTGKSQTISNLIAHCLSRGQRVLFVAEKLAALNVVYQRLCRVGLSPFCLELHSDRVRKKDVLSQLETALRCEVDAGPADADSLNDSLFEQRSRLNRLVEALHSQRPIGFSVFEARTRLIAAHDLQRVECRFDAPETIQAEPWREWRQTLSRVAFAAQGLGKIAEHPLSGIGCSRWSSSLPHDMERLVASARAASESLSKSAADALRALGAAHSHPLSSREIEWLRRLVTLLEDHPQVPAELLAADPFAALRRQIVQALEQAKTAQEIRRDLEQKYSREWFDLDHPAHALKLAYALEMPAVLRWFAVRTLRKRLRPWMLPGRTIDDTHLLADLEASARMRQLERKLAGDVAVAKALGPCWKSGHGHLFDCSRMLSIAEEWHALRSDSGPAQETLERLLTSALAFLCEPAASRAFESEIREPLNVFLAGAQAFRTAFDALVSLLQVDLRKAFGEDGAEGFLQRFRQILDSWSQHRQKLNDWIHWRRVRTEAAAVFEPFLEALEDGRIGSDLLVPVFERSFLEQWHDRICDQEPVLRDFNSRQQQQEVDRFIDLDRRHLGTTARVLAAALKRRMPTVDETASEASEVGILLRQLRLQRRHLPVRRLLQKIPNLALRLKPCFLMSPLSVAQYLDPELPPFDVVVFDEASQIPVWDAVGAMARGRSVIVVGDSRQLPPTSFFHKLELEGEVLAEEPDVEELESVLDECVASGIGSMRLLWHYRSRHESLISFSNYHYYGNRLLTFPSAAEHAPDLGIAIRRVSGAVFDRGGTRTNRTEAGAVVAEIVARLSAMAQGAPAHSIGVVTFSQPQQALIEDLLEEKRAQHPDIEPFFSPEHDEPVFVKNLENVQGDERDLMIFSIGYGRDGKGRLHMNFGPLNLTGGERRLNVAITRARRQILVFTSLDPEEIDLSRTRALAVHHLKRFLEYAKQGIQSFAEATVPPKAPRKDGAEEWLLRALASRGLDVRREVGSSGYRLDLAVADKGHPSRFVLGIELDGEHYQNAATARDRDRLRAQVLQGLGWNLKRIWSHDLWVAPNETLARLDARIEEILAQRRTDKGQRAEGPFASDVAVVSSQVLEVVPPVTVRLSGSGANQASSSSGRAEYRRCRLRQRSWTSERFLEEQSRAEIVQCIEQVLEVEAPIVFKELLQRIADAVSIERISPRLQDHFEEILHAPQYASQWKRALDAFWRPEQEPESFALYRAGGGDELRAADRIPRIEYQVALRDVLKRQISLPRADLVRESCRALGFLRLSRRLEETAQAALEQLIESRTCEIVAGRVRLPEGE